MQKQKQKNKKQRTENKTKGMVSEGIFKDVLVFLNCIVAKGSFDLYLDFVK